jgi:hypothetical protein
LVKINIVGLASAMRVGKQAYHIKVLVLPVLLVMVVMTIMIMFMFMMLLGLQVAVGYKVVASQQNVGNRKQYPTK